MFLSAVILILQEILEASLLISVLLVLTSALRKLRPDLFTVDLRWVLSAIAIGIAGAWLYAWATPAVSLWFDYAGYEVVNAFLQSGILAFVLIFCYLINSNAVMRTPHGYARLARVCMIVVVATSIIREGSEITLYIQGTFGQRENISPVMLGALMATGIGISGSIVLFHALRTLPPRWTFRVAMLLLALFSGNMAAQAVQLLTQADWLPYTPQLWDSSFLIDESGITGHVLFTLVGYQANPAMLQAGIYFAAVILVACSPLFRNAWISAARNPA